MKRMPPEQRRAELIAAAVRVIARDGVTAASTRAIVSTTRSCDFAAISVM